MGAGAQQLSSGACEVLGLIPAPQEEKKKKTPAEKKKTKTG
jgi:hypothetical protein